MNKQMNTNLLGTGLLIVALAGGIGAWAFGQPPQPGKAAGVAPPEAAEKGGDEADEIVIKLADAPEPVRTALAKLTPADKVTKVIKETDEGITTYEVEYQADGMNCSAVFAAAGDVMEIEKGVKETALPPAALAALKKEYPKAAIADSEMVTKTYYEVHIVSGGQKHAVKVDAAGNIDDGSDGDEHAALDEADEQPAKAARGAPPGGDGWRADFAVNKADLSPTGAGAYFVLQPGRKTTYAADDVVLVVTVLDETRVVDGVTTRVIEERESKAGALVEVSRNFFAIEPKTGDAYYFGEEVDIYKDGKVARHEGEWLSGKDGARFGLFIPGAPRVGDKFYQEVAVGNALDRFEIVSLTERLETPAGKFEKVVKAAETTPLEAGTGFKWFAPGVGMIRDGDLKLTKIEPHAGR